MENCQISEAASLIKYELNNPYYFKPTAIKKFQCTRINQPIRSTIPEKGFWVIIQVSSIYIIPIYTNVS